MEVRCFNGQVGWGSGRGVGALVAAVLAVSGVVLVLVAAAHQQPAPPGVAATHEVRRSPAPAPPAGAPAGRAGAGPADLDDAVRGPVLPESGPVRLEIPRLGVRTGLDRLGLTAGGALEAPADPAVPGWYTGAPSPGALGPAVVAGHLTWDRRPAVFFRLAELRPGDRVRVLRADHRTAVFAVRRVQGFDKLRFPTLAVYGPTDHAALRLVTCGGRYDAGRRRFDDNVVVFADLVAVSRP